jgi:hypothetical protein
MLTIAVEAYVKGGNEIDELRMGRNYAEVAPVGP